MGEEGGSGGGLCFSLIPSRTTNGMEKWGRGGDAGSACSSLPLGRGDTMRRNRSREPLAGGQGHWSQEALGKQAGKRGFEGEVTLKKARAGGGGCFGRTKRGWVQV